MSGKIHPGVALLFFSSKASKASKASSFAPALRRRRHFWGDLQQGHTRFRLFPKVFLVAIDEVPQMPFPSPFDGIELHNGRRHPRSCLTPPPQPCWSPSHASSCAIAALVTHKTASMADLTALGDGMTDALMKQFKKIQKKTFKEQAVWFMNGFWCDGPNFAENEEQREKMWDYVERMGKLHPDGVDGNELDEFKAHQFLEKSDMHMTVAKMRTVMKEIDLDFNKSISMTEFLIFHYKVKMIDVVNA